MPITKKVSNNKKLKIMESINPQEILKMIFPTTGGSLSIEVIKDRHEQMQMLETKKGKDIVELYKCLCIDGKAMKEGTMKAELMQLRDGLALDISNFEKLKSHYDKGNTDEIMKSMVEEFRSIKK